MKFVADLITTWHRMHMSELGREILEEFRRPEVRWTMSPYTLTHKPSGMELWISNGRSHLHVHAMPNTGCSDRELKELLNWHDRHVLWKCVQVFYAKVQRSPLDAALNTLRLSRHKEN